ncbi:acyltransferase family protein [Salinarimonas soli]|uniref:Acyltransferase n=1 Tax=Salinarimonas soli TaxID=1638099 RepID=A0A5B2V8J4_9HYPH|nr:acyltransferase [Salinarimonas soli]KAA2234780.1 acyltransferase [Salinarimonas soli]
MDYRPLGAYRTLLASLVVMQHVNHIAPVGWTVHHFASGTLSVLAFFSLSGFVITEAAEKLYRGRPVAFLINRALRLGPQYLLALAVSMLTVWACSTLAPHYFPSALIHGSPSEMFSVTNVIKNILSIIPGIKAEHPFVPYAWALRVEAIFYFILAGGILISARRPTLGIIGISGGCAALFGMFLAGKAPSMMQNVPYFAFGAVLYWTIRSPSIGRHMILAALFVLSLWTCVTVTLPETFSLAFDPAERLVHVSLFSILLLMPWWLASLPVSPRVAVLDRRIGDLSFPLYLQHFAVIVAVHAALPASYFTVAVVFAASGVLAVIADRVVETPLRLLRDRIRGRALDAAGSPMPMQRLRSSA